MILKTVNISTIFIALSLLGCLSCDSKTEQIETDLIGTWKLDSASTLHGNYYKSTTEVKSLKFNKENDYSYEWWNGDVGNIETGKYFVLSNPKRRLKTITFIPDIQFSGKDTIRLYMNLDIKSMSPSRLVVVGETEFVKRGSLPYVKFNETDIYKRIK